jgi:hypothetical protein
MVNNKKEVGFEIFTAVIMKSTTVWDVTPSSEV